jgi:hypothetical protein
MIMSAMVWWSHRFVEQCRVNCWQQVPTHLGQVPGLASSAEGEQAQDRSPTDRLLAGSVKSWIGCQGDRELAP